jgi:hypothetical protein
MAINGLLNVVVNPSSLRDGPGDADDRVEGEGESEGGEELHM